MELLKIWNNATLNVPEARLWFSLCPISVSVIMHD